MKKASGDILFISNDASRTGAPIFLLRFLQWFQKNHTDTFRILAGNHGKLGPEFEALCRVDYFEPQPTFAYKVVRRLKLNQPLRTRHQKKLRAIVSDGDIRLIYCNTIANGKILDHLSFLQCPVICHVHELESSIRHFGPENMALIKKYTTRYIAASQSVKSNLTAGHDIPADRIRLIYSFIPDTRLQPPGDVAAGQSVREELGIPLKSKLVCIAGSTDHRKGTDLLLRVAETVQGSGAHDSVHFMWVGGRWDQIRALRKEIQASPLRETVHFIGPREDVTRYYDASDVFLLTSREDPFPLVMLEAASRELPIVCFADSGGGPEFVENDAGIVIPDFDTSKMADAVMHLLASPELGRKMGRAGQQKVTSRYTLSIGAPKIAQVIHEQLWGAEHRATA